MFVSEAGSLRFISRARQMGHIIANVSRRWDISSKEAVLPRRNDAEMDPQNRCTLLRITARIMKDLI